MNSTNMQSRDMPTAFQRLADAFEAAAFTPSSWPDALSMLADACGARHGQLLGLTESSAVMMNWIAPAFDPALLEAARLLHTPDINYRVSVGRQVAEGVVADDSDYDRAIPQLDDDRYIRFCEEHRIRHGCQAVLRADAATLVGLAVLGDTRLTPEQREAFARAVPLARTAVRIQSSLEGQGAALIAGTLDAMSIAAIILDPVGRVSAVTSAAERLVAHGQMFRISEGRLSAAAPEDDRALQLATRASLSAPPRARAQSLVFLGASTGERARIVDVLSLPRRDWAMPFEPRTAVVIRGEGTRPMDAQLLQRAFGLTAAEAEVATDLASGRSRAEIAQARRVSEGTVHAQVRSIFAKLDVSREARLITRVRDLLVRL